MLAQKLFENETPETRGQLLRNYAQGIEEITYLHEFSDEELDDLKHDLSQKDMKIEDMEEEKKEWNEDFKLRFEPLKKEQQELLKSIRFQSKSVTRECFRIIDLEDGKMGYYDATGRLVSKRALRPNERQLSFQMLINGQTVDPSTGETSPE